MGRIKFLRGFDIPMDHLIPVKRPDTEVTNKKKKVKREFSVLLIFPFQLTTA